MIGLRRELQYVSWFPYTFIASCFFLSFLWAARTLMILPQSLLPNDGDSHFNSGVILYMIYFCIVLIAYAVSILVLFEGFEDSSHLEKPKYVLILHTLHIITYFILSFDWYKILLEIMQLG